MIYAADKSPFVEPVRMFASNNAPIDKEADVNKIGKGTWYINVAPH